MTNEERQAIEARIMRSAIEELLSYDFTLGVFDGEEVTIKDSTDAEAIFNAMRTTDEDLLLVWRTIDDGRKTARFGSIYFVYGNDGWDVINDHSTCLEDYLTATNDLAERLSGSLCACGNSLGDGEGFDGLCGSCADKKGVFKCQGCGREESVCSADPCPSVIADREAN